MRKIKQHPFLLNSYITSIIHKKPIKNQFIFSFLEYSDKGVNDPLDEKSHSPVRGLVHRYPDRVVLTITNKCFAYCRFCFRKDNWNNFEGFDLENAIKYIEKNKKIEEVLISGGDPFFLNNTKIEQILKRLTAIKHIKFIRIGTRVLSAMPSRINIQTINILKKYKPLWIAAHINHPDEITGEFIKAVHLFTDNGMPILSQTVLLKNINDDAKILKNLFCTLVSLNIKPYYLFGCDQAIGNSNFRVSIKRALEIMKTLRGNISGICMPNFAFDLPNGGGKIILEPDRILKHEDKHYLFKNFENKEFGYEDI